MAIYIQLSFLRINLVLVLSLAACAAEQRPPVSRAWPVLGTMMSAAAWGADSARVARALDAARDSVDRVDSLLGAGARIAALDSLRREIRRRTGVAPVRDSIAAGYALDRAARALAGVVDSALLNVGGQFLWVGPAARPTHRTVGIADPDNSLRALAAVEMRAGSVRTRAVGDQRRGHSRSVTVLAPDGLTADAWAAVFVFWGCDSALAAARGVSVVCADSAGVRWTRDLQNRVSIRTARVP